MKKAQRILREFDKLKKDYRQLEEIVKNTKTGNLWNHEAAIRKKIKALKEFKYQEINEFHGVYENYLSFLDNVSKRLLEHYNKKNNCSYRFEDITATDKAGYISSGIISVLITSHIPELVAGEFTKYFPRNPKDEYDTARKIKRRFFLHLGQTNTGKTYNSLQRLKQASCGVYLAPLRILALENYEKLNREGVPCHLLTGEEEMRVEGANHISCTIEKLNSEQSYDVAVIDEIQMIGGTQRGQAWTRALLGLQSEEIHICGAINTKELLIKIIEDCGDSYEITEYVRDVPLLVMNDPFELKQAESGDALVVFSKRRVLELYQYFTGKKMKASVIYGDLPPEVRRMQYDAFISGENKILVTTDAIGMGVNLPIRRVIFMDIKKFDGEEIRYLTSQEIKQIAGRAGRKGIYDVGYVGVNSISQQFIAESLDADDEPVNSAIVGPSEAILKIKNLPLREKLALWSTREETLPYYKKMDVRDGLLILDSVKSFRLAEADEYKLIRLPFDVNSNDMLLLFLEYVEQFFKKHVGALTKPKMKSGMLPDLEIYYQMINLYYSFSKSFHIDFDEQWVYHEREIISKKINHLLLRM